MSFFKSQQIQPTAASPVLGQGGQQGVLGSLLTQMGYNGPGASGQGLNLPFMPQDPSALFGQLFQDPFTMTGGNTNSPGGGGGFSSLFSQPQSGSVLGQPQTVSGTSNTPSGGSYLDFMTQMAQGKGASSPISAVPAWNDMVAAQERNISKGGADLSSMFNTQGGRFSSDFGNAATDYQTEARLGENSILSQMQLPLLQQSQQIQAGAGMALPGTMLNKQQVGLQTAMAPYQLQNSYMQNLMGMANMYPPMIQPQYAPSGFSQLMGGLGSLGGLMTGFGGFGSLFGGASEPTQYLSPGGHAF